MYLHLTHTHTSTFTGMAVKASRTRCYFYTHIFTHFWQLHYVFMYLTFIQYELCSYWKRFQCHRGLCSFMWMIMLNTTSWGFSTFCLLDNRGEVLPLQMTLFQYIHFWIVPLITCIMFVNLKDTFAIQEKKESEVRKKYHLVLFRNGQWTTSSCTIIVTNTNMAVASAQSIKKGGNHKRSGHVDSSSYRNGALSLI